MLVAKEYEILRGVIASPRFKTPLARKPLRVAYLMDEDDLVKSGGVLRHHHNVFLDERLHDWDHLNGQFTYYSHAVEPNAAVDVVVVYSLQD